MGSAQGDDLQLNGDLACANAEIRGQLKVAGMAITPSGSVTVMSTFAAPLLSGPAGPVYNLAPNTFNVAQVNDAETIVLRLPNAPAAGAQVWIVVVVPGNAPGGGDVTCQGADLIMAVQPIITLTCPPSSWSRTLFVYDGAGAWAHYDQGQGF